MEKLRFGILGCGGIAARFAKALAKSDCAELYACAARDPERAEAFRAAHGAAVAFGSYEALVNDPAVDAVYIATVHSAHAECARLCIEAGKAVLCEKPFFVTSAEAEAIIALAREKRVLVMEGFWTRTVPAYARVKQWIAEGRIGDVKLIRADFCFNVPYNDETKNHRLWKPDTAGGALLDAGVYPYEYVTGLMGRAPDSLVYAVDRGPTGVDATVAMTMHYASGTIAQCTASITAKLDTTAVISGTEGWITQDYFVGPRRCALYDRTGTLLECFEDPEEEGFVHEIAHFAGLSRAGKTESGLIPLTDSLDFVRAAEHILAGK